MKGKRIIALLLTAAVAIGLMTACGSSGSAGGSNETAEEAESTWDKIEAAGVLTVGTEGTYSPYTFHDSDDNLVGYDVEVVEAIGDKLGIDIEWTEGNFDGLIAGMDANKYDMVANQITITEERLQKYIFSDPYTYVFGVIITRDDYDEISSFEDLDGKQIALTTTSNWAQLSESYGATIVPTNGFPESIQLVQEERADGTVNDNVTFLDYLNQKPDAKVKIAAASDEINESALIMRKDDTDLRDKINEALKELADEGTLTEISMKYFGEDISKK